MSALSSLTWLRENYVQEEAILLKERYRKSRTSENLWTFPDVFTKAKAINETVKLPSVIYCLTFESHDALHSVLVWVLYARSHCWGVSQENKVRYHILLDFLPKTFDIAPLFTLPSLPSLEKFYRNMGEEIEGTQSTVTVWEKKRIKKYVSTKTLEFYHNLPRKVVVKQSKGHPLNCLHEIQALQTLQPDMLPILGAWVHPTQLNEIICILPYVGKDMWMMLEDYVSLHQGTSKGIPLNYALKISLEVAKAIEKLHKNNIGHGDLKLENILIKKLPCTNKPFDVTLCDYSTVWSPEGPLQTKTCWLFSPRGGTVPYIDPLRIIKQLQTTDAIGDSAPIGTKLHLHADIYSLSIIMYMLLYGCYPIDCDSFEDYKRHIRSRRQKSFCVLSTKFNKELEQLPMTLQDLLSNMSNFNSLFRPSISYVINVLHVLLSENMFCDLPEGQFWSLCFPESVSLEPSQQHHRQQVDKRESPHEEIVDRSLEYSQYPTICTLAQSCPTVPSFPLSEEDPNVSEETSEDPILLSHKYMFDRALDDFQQAVTLYDQYQKCLHELRQSKRRLRTL